MRARTYGIWLVLAAAHALAAGCPRRGEAATQVNGVSYVEDAATSNPTDEFNLFQSGMSLDIQPATKKKLKTNLNLRLDYVRSDEDELANFSPFGNLGLDLSGESYAMSVQQTRQASLGTTTELTETTLSRASFVLSASELPRISANLSRTDSETGSSPSTRTDTGSLSLDYRYAGVQVRAGYSADRRESSAGASNRSSSAFVGLGASRELLLGTVLRGDVDLNWYDASSSAGGASATTGRTLRFGADSRPISWLGLAANLTRTTTEFVSGASGMPATTNQLAEASATVFPHASLQLGATIGNRRFDDLQTDRSVDYRIVSAAFSRELLERFLVGATASRSFESDPGQGENVSDNFGVNAAANLTSRISLRVNAALNRAEDRTFVSAQVYGASGTLAERDQLDRDSGGLPPGFTFFDTIHNDVYTKGSSAIGDWTLTAHVDPVVGRFAASRSIQITAVPTDRMNVSLSYSATASADSPGVVTTLGSQSVNGSFTYLATRRSNLGLAGTATFPELGDATYSATGSYSYRLLRGHQLSLTYGRKVSVVGRSDDFSASLKLSLRKRTSLDMTYLATQLFRDERTQYGRVRLSHSF